MPTAVGSRAGSKTMKEDVEAVLETLRPMLLKDGGNVELVESSSEGTAFRLTLPIAEMEPEL